MSKHLVLSVKSYDFENKNGERITGAKVSYVNKKASTRDQEYGHPPMIVSVSNVELVQQFREIPGIYEMDFEQVTGKNNKPEIILSDVELVEPMALSSFF